MLRIAVMLGMLYFSYNSQVKIVISTPLYKIVDCLINTYPIHLMVVFFRNKMEMKILSKGPVTESTRNDPELLFGH